MILYLLRFSLAVVVFYGFYRIALQDEKNHVFNRVYLILGLVISLIVPIISISGSEPVKLLISQAEPHLINPVVLRWQTLLLNVYFAVTALLLIRFCVGIFRIVQIILNNEHRLFDGGKVVLMGTDSPPFSFLHYVFVSKDKYDKIEKELMDHELAHVQQWHSLDLLFMEILMVLFWFNPILIFYKRSMKLNHEFLADANVLQRSRNVKRYQEILLSYLQTSSSVRLGSGFNFSLTRKRFRMMTYPRRKAGYYKQALVLPMVILVFWACSDNEGVSGKEMLKYWRYTANMEEVLQTGMMNEEDLKEGIILPIEDKQQYDELQSIYNRMNKAQKESVYPLPGYLEPLPSDNSKTH